MQAGPEPSGAAAPLIRALRAPQGHLRGMVRPDAASPCAACVRLGGAFL